MVAESKPITVTEVTQAPAPFPFTQTVVTSLGRISDITNVPAGTKTGLISMRDKIRDNRAILGVTSWDFNARRTEYENFSEKLVSVLNAYQVDAQGDNLNAPTLAVLENIAEAANFSFQRWYREVEQIQFYMPQIN